MCPSWNSLDIDIKTTGGNPAGSAPAAAPAAASAWTDSSYLMIRVDSCLTWSPLKRVAWQIDEVSPIRKQVRDLTRAQAISQPIPLPLSLPAPLSLPLYSLTVTCGVNDRGVN